MTGCEMKGFLTFLTLRIIATNQPITGKDIREEIGRRKGQKPSSGTIYPVIKNLLEKKLIELQEQEGKEKKYRLTNEGKKELKIANQKFIRLFSGMKNEF